MGDGGREGKERGGLGNVPLSVDVLLILVSDGDSDTVCGRRRVSEQCRLHSPCRGASETRETAVGKRRTWWLFLARDSRLFKHAACGLTADCWLLAAGCWMLDVGCRLLNIFECPDSVESCVLNAKLDLVSPDMRTSPRDERR